MSSNALANLPSIEKLLRRPSLAAWEEKIQQPVRVQLAQNLVAHYRDLAKQGKDIPESDVIEKELEGQFQKLLSGAQKRVINATGVALHTNLGRAALGKELLQKMADELWGYSTLEFDLETGERGSRTRYVEELCRLLAGVEAAIVVNNCAAATYLILHGLAQGKEVPISRGELVQIGGGFRVPDIMKASGAKLVEVGTTNMTSARDYEKAINDQTGLVLQVHQSNFYLSGHTEAPPLSEIVEICRKKNVTCAVDLGSGCLVNQKLDGDEPTVSQVVRAGVDILCFSGDKLLGGPQAGILAGKKDLIDKLKSSPMYRAMRLGKTELFLLEQTLLKYVSGDRPALWGALEASTEDIRARAKDLLSKLPKGSKIVDGTSGVGGGTMPGCQIPTALLELFPAKPERLAKRLRRASTPLIVRREKKRILLDLRTVFHEEEGDLVASVNEAWEEA